MCPAIGKAVSNFQLAAPSVKTSLCDYRAVQELTGKLVIWGVLEKEEPIPSLLGDFHPSFGEMLLFAWNISWASINLVGVSNTMAGCACKLEQEKLSMSWCFNLNSLRQSYLEFFSL